MPNSSAFYFMVFKINELRLFRIIAFMSAKFSYLANCQLSNVNSGSLLMISASTFSNKGMIIVPWEVINSNNSLNMF